MALFLLAAIGRLVVDDVLPPGFPFLTFFPAVILATFFAGLWSGVATALASTVTAWYLFIPPFQTFAVNPGAGVALVFFIIVVGVDIAVIHVMNTALDRLDAERERSAQLSRQAQTMFTELQHRVSNNLQLVSGMLAIQQAKVADSGAAKALDDARARVATLGRLHRMLHDPNRQNLDLGRYLSELCRDVVDAAGAAHVVLTVEAEPVSLAPDKLVPLALIVAELLANTLEHAFPDGRAGRVWVTLGRRGRGLVLSVRDDGAGLPASFDLEGQASLGLQIVRALAGQLGGRLTMVDEGGVLASLEFSP